MLYYRERRERAKVTVDLDIGLLFPADPLMIVNFGNRYTLLANLIRKMHDEVIREIYITNTPLDIHLSDLQKHREWQQYLKPKCGLRAKAEKNMIAES